MPNRVHIQHRIGGRKRMRRHSRRHRHQSTIRKTGHNSVIHISIRPRDTVSSSINTSVDHHNNLNTYSANLDTHYRRNELKAASNIQSLAKSSKNQTYSDNMISRKLQQNYRSLSPSSENTNGRNHRNKISLQQENKFSTRIVDNQQYPYEIYSTSSDKMGSIKDHHHNRNEKKKKKRLRLCVITSVLVAVVFLIAMATLLAVFLTKSKTTQHVLPANNITLRWSKTADTVAGVAGQLGVASNLLSNPFGLTVDSYYTLYIADCNNNRIQRWLRGASTGTTVCGQANGTAGRTSSDLRTPAGVLVDSRSNIYVGDGANARVQLWSAGATSGVTIAGNGTFGNSSGQLNNPYGVSLDSNSGTLYIADYANHRIMSYASGASSGTMAAGTGVGGTNMTQLFYPTGVYFDSPSKSLIIVNCGANNVVLWTLGASNWTIIGGSTSGLAGNASTLLSCPVGLTVDPMGNVYVADMINSRIQLFLVGQSNAITIGGITGEYGTNSTVLNRPYGVALDNQLNLYVSDTYNNRVQRFLRY